MSLRTASVAGGPVLVWARDPVVIATARAAAKRMRRRTALLQNGRQALSLLTAPGRVRHQLVCDRDAAEAACWSQLVAVAAEQEGRAALLVVSDDPVGALPPGMRPVPTDSAILAAALRANQHGDSPGHEAVSLKSALLPGEITVRYQPMVRLADRRPVMLEALARWAPSYPPVGPDLFLPLVAKAGLMRPLSVTVARSAVAEIAPLRSRLRMGVTVNLPLDLLLQPDLPGWLRQALGRSAMTPADLSIELTEHAEVLDRSTLERALRRLRHAGHGVFLDDIVLDDPRARLFGLDFSGLKLDRSVVTALSTSAAARQAVRRLLRGAAAAGQVVVAEGVTHPAQMRLLAELGIDWAQGFLISRPLPAAALPAWLDQWRAGRTG